METILQSIESDHQQIIEWLSNVQFCEDELGVFRKQLSEISAKNSQFDVRAMIEHFENQFIIKKELIDTNKHLLRAHEHELKERAARHPYHIHHHYLRENKQLTNTVESFLASFTDLKDEFNQFLSKHL